MSMTFGAGDPFLDALLSFESGIDPARGPQYAAGFDVPSLEYWKVRETGVLWRDMRTGRAAKEVISYAEYFRRLGYPLTRHQLTPEWLGLARYHAINPWGFVGFQLGEAALIDAGHYLPKIVFHEGRPIASYYTGTLTDATWANGVESTVYFPSNHDAPIMATNRNRWEGSFTGKDGVCCFEDLLSPSRQRRVMTSIITRNLLSLEDLIRKAGSSPAEIVRQRGVTITGCAAACHLVGTYGTFRMLMTGKDATDEIGTSASMYCIHFGKFQAGAWLEASRWI